MDTIHKPTLTRQVLKGTIYSCPTRLLIESFSKLPVNICVVGMSTLTLAYSYSKRLPYITGFYKGAVQWGTLLKKLKETLLMNATAGATIHVFYHDGNYLVKVIKPATVPFIPHGLL
jgi:hypothetical protein